MKRILLITENLGSGGAERQLCGLAVMLKKRGYTVRVITYVRNQFYEPMLREAGVEYRLVEKAFNHLRRLPVLLRELKDFRPDVVISFLRSVNKTMCLLRLAYRSKLIVSERNFTLNWNRSTRLLHRLYSVADYVVPNSEAEAENIKEHCAWLTKKTVAIPNFTDTERFHPADEPQCNDVFTILSVGRVTEQKNILTYVRALAKVRDAGLAFHAIWVGSQKNEEYFNKVKTLIGQYNLSEYIEMRDQTEDIADFYRQADAFCLPSVFEGYPNVLCEAMASGLPVACSNIQEMPRIVQEEINGYLFDPYNADDIAMTLKRLIATPAEKLSEMSQANRAQILANNTVEAFADRYISLIESFR